MSHEIFGFVLLAVFLFAIFIGFPVSFTLIFLSLAFGYFLLGDLVFYLTVLQTIGLMKEEVLAAVPLFIFMGYLLEEGGLMERLFHAFRLLMGGIAGSLYVAVLATATIFGIAAGTVGATVAVVGIMAVPTMVRAGYDARLSAGSITAGGSLGILIPPSVMLVVMGPVMGVSVAELYASSFGPGFLLAGLFIAWTLVRCWINPRLGPPLPPAERAGSLRTLVVELTLGMLPHVILTVVTLGPILAGMATPTEAAAVGVVGTVIMAALYRALSWARLKEAVIQTAQQSSMVFFLAVASNIFGAVFTRLGSATLLTDTLVGLPLPPLGILLVVMFLIFLLGWPFEWPAIVLVFVPLMQPAMIALKIDQLWFATLIAVNLQTAFLSPPVAMAAYYLKGVAPDWKLTDIYWGMAEFMVLQVVGLAIVVLYPPIALWFPHWLYGQ
ncbi:MAG TPA: TRAP transporter large permease subunit [Candidatus Tectomicrobia bacterium]|nr:TRAP transporter large permease subunit [Candidatus Tectomicrobia bacterium]